MKQLEKETVRTGDRCSATRSGVGLSLRVQPVVTDRSPYAQGGAGSGMRHYDVAVQ